MGQSESIFCFRFCFQLSRYNLPMPCSAAEILEEARKLSAAERDWLIGVLLRQEEGTAEELFAAWQKEVGESEPGYEEWFRAGVEEALADDSTGTPHEQIKGDIEQVIRRVKQDENRATISP
jgi:hypothetical protein